MSRLTVSIFGLGYVGIVSAACFARDGINVIGVDVNESKVDEINQGKAPIIESGLGELLKQGVTNNRIKATTDYKEAVENSDVSIISVGTPSRGDGALDLKYVYRVCEQIGEVLAEKESEHVVILRSTVFPGTTKECEQIIQDKAGHDNFSIGFNPEFLREGSAIKDFDDPAYTIIGTDDDKTEEVVKRLYATVDAPIHTIAPEEAELIKYASNAWHATKINFANEIGRIAKDVDVNGRTVMDILVSDTKLNTSEAYMKPGFAYGGSCLPKDVRALDYYGKVNNLSLPLISSLSESNKAQLDFAYKYIASKDVKNIGMLGLAFKPGTDDLRESPAVELAERLIGKGYNLKIIDPAVYKSKLIGSNKEFIENKIPHLSKLMVNDSQELVDHAELLLVTHGAAEFREILDANEQDKIIFDLTGIFKNGIPSDELNGRYEGISW